jgi:hypothetical protein
MERDAFIGSKKTCELIDNCSQMHLWRLLNDRNRCHLRSPRRDTRCEPEWSSGVP